MKKIFFIFAFVLLILILTNSIAASLADVKYPVTELANCNSQAECEKYCDDINNMEPCLSFAEKNGIMTSEELAEARKFIPLMKSGYTPGGCKNQRECKAYCDDDANLNVCIEFAKKSGIIDEKEYEMVKKTGGKGPGGCKGKKECDDYCNNDENFNVCIEFAKEHGMINDKDYEMAKKTGGKGPGGCKSKEECDVFCNNPDNQETCMNFAIEHDLLSEAEFADMKKNQEFMNSEEGKCQMQCLKDAGVDSKSCGEGGAGPQACKTCGEKCFSHDKTSGGKCLSQEKWQQLDADCKARGTGYHLEEVKGDNGQGGECVVDETCVYSSGTEWENQEEKDRQLAEMQKKWDEEKAKYEAENGPGSHQDNSGGGGGGCTEPGPEGQCNPGPGAGPGSGSDGSGAGTSGDGFDERGSSGSSEGSDSSNGGGSTGSSEGSSSDSSSDSSSSSSSLSNGESAPATGAAVYNNNINGWLINVIKWIFRV